MFVTPLPQLKTPTKADFGVGEDAPGINLILGTGRSYGQHNTVVYRPEDKYRGMPHRHCLLMNQIDGKKAGREGVGFMFYPEANILFKAKIDPRCGTPAYKRVPVWVY